MNAKAQSFKKRCLINSAKLIHPKTNQYWKLILLKDNLFCQCTILSDEAGAIALLEDWLSLSNKCKCAYLHKMYLYQHLIVKMKFILADTVSADKYSFIGRYPIFPF